MLLVVGIGAGVVLALEFLHALLGPGEYVLASADHCHALLVFRDGLLKTDLTGLDALDDLLEVLEGGLERQLVVVAWSAGWLALGGHGVTLGRHAAWGAVVWDQPAWGPAALLTPTDRLMSVTSSGSNSATVPTTSPETLRLKRLRREVPMMSVSQPNVTV